VESQFPHISRGLGRGGDKKSAFTLAEVLITLGVIGVVASITLPTLIKEYNKHAWVNALKQNYSLLNQGFKKMMADDGVEFIADTEVWRAMTYDCYHGYIVSLDQCKNFYPQLGKYFKIVSIEDISGKYKFKVNTTEYTAGPSATGQPKNHAMYLSNGAMIWRYYFYKNPNISSNCDAIHNAGGHMCGLAGDFYIDVNGNRGPNELGKDIFYFYITERGQLVPEGGNDYAIYNASPNLTQENIYKYKAIKGSNGECLFGSNSSCGKAYTGLLIDQLNWKMDY
ncbi:type II secretion system protein, partial [bacterium]|nr:type II secretion system protein [bacterium]